MKKFILTLIVLFIIGLIAFSYYTRPAPLPSIENQTSNATSSNVYVISQEESTAEFRIDEVLNGSPFTAVGTTHSIHGEFKLIDENGIRSPELSEIKINARTLKTDNENRDGAISRLILKSDQTENEFITFRPIDVIGGPDSFEYNKEYNFQVLGDMTISGVTKQVSFNIQAVATKEKAEVEAHALIKRSDFNLVIPNIPFVASVENEFEINASLIANK